MASVTLKDDTFKQVIDTCYQIAINLIHLGIDHYTKELSNSIVEERLTLAYDVQDDGCAQEEDIGIVSLCMSSSSGYAHTPWSNGDLPAKIISLHERLMGEIGDTLIGNEGFLVDLVMTDDQKKYAEETFIPLYEVVIL